LTTRSPVRKRRNGRSAAQRPVAITDSFLKSLAANFVFFGIPGAVLLLATQLFSFFNRFNAFAAQANYLNVVESAKKTPARVDRLIQKLWEYVYRDEFLLFAQGRSNEEQCAEVEAIIRRRVDEEARLLRQNALAMEAAAAREDRSGDDGTGSLDDEARARYEARLARDKAEGYARCLPWDRMSPAERRSALSRIVREEAVEEIARKGLCYCELGFKHNAAWTLATPMHLNFKYERCGIDLKLVEDWMDGAFFDITDIKLIEEYIAEATLRSVKLQARVPMVPFLMFQGMRNFWQRLWAYMVLGITAKRIGRYLTHLNLRYVQEEASDFCRDYFKAEAFFWPSEAYDRDVAERVGQRALDRPDQLRRRWLFLTLGKLKAPRVSARHDPERIGRRLARRRTRAVRSAARLLQRLFAGTVYTIHELRPRRARGLSHQRDEPQAPGGDRALAGAASLPEGPHLRDPLRGERSKAKLQPAHPAARHLRNIGRAPSQELHQRDRPALPPDRDQAPKRARGAVEAPAGHGPAGSGLRRKQ